MGPRGIFRSRSTAAESECVSARIDAHPRTTPPDRASPVRRPTRRGGYEPTDRWPARRRSTAPQLPSTRPRPVSRNQAATAVLRPPPPVAGRPLPAEASPAIQRSRVEQAGLLLPLAGIRSQFLANRPEMSRRAVAREVPFLGSYIQNTIETLKSRFGRPLFRGVFRGR
jgi:hypothetical protein